jgi:hypothetical protein
MNKNWVNLPSGKIINLTNIAVIEQGDRVRITFIGPTVITLEDKDCLPFLKKIGTHVLAR